MNGFGHLICISDFDSADEFADICRNVQLKINEKNKILSEELRKLFKNINNYLVIPHYEKEPNVKKEMLIDLKKYILCGEVSSVKKFMYCQKNILLGIDTTSFEIMYRKNEVVSLFIWGKYRFYLFIKNYK